MMLRSVTFMLCPASAYYSVTPPPLSLDGKMLSFMPHLSTNSTVVKLFPCCSSIPCAIFFCSVLPLFIQLSLPLLAFPSFIIASSFPLFARTGLLLRRFFIIQVVHYICCRSLLHLHHFLVAFRIITELFDLFIPPFSLFSSHFLNPFLPFLFFSSNMLLG